MNTIRCGGRLNGQAVSSTVCLNKADHDAHDIPSDKEMRQFLKARGVETMGWMDALVRERYQLAVSAPQIGDVVADRQGRLWVVVQDVEEQSISIARMNDRAVVKDVAVSQVHVVDRAGQS